jgi:hypothetical protein
MRSSFQHHNLHQPIVSIHDPVAFFDHVFHFCKIKENSEKFEETKKSLTERSDPWKR